MTGPVRHPGAFAVRSVAATPLAAITGLALLATSPNAVCAQVSGTRTITLDEALSIAVGGNPELRRAVNSQGLNGSEMRTVWAEQLLPRASLTLFESAFRGNLQRQAFDDFGNPIANPDAQWNYFSQTAHRLNLAWSFQGLSLFQGHRRQRLTNVDRDLAYEEALSGVRIEVQRLYLDALEQRVLRELEEELIEARRTDLAIAERLFSLAGRTRVDVLNAELAVERQTLTHAQQSTAYDRAALALRTALGMDEEGPIDLATEELPVFDPGAFDPDALLSRAFEVSPTVRRSVAGVESARLGLSEQKTGWWPRVDAGFSLYKQAFGQDAGALFDPSVSGDLESQFFVQFSFPVLGGLSQQTTDQARANVDLRNRLEEDREARLRLEETVRGALLDLENQWQAFQISERSQVIAEEALRLAREEYRLGVRTFEDLRSTFQQEADTRRALIQARHAFVDALLALEEAVGGPLRDGIPTGSDSSPEGS